MISSLRDTLDLHVPIRTRVKVLPPRDETTGKIIAEAGVQITGRVGRVIAPSVDGKLAIQLDGGGVFHLEPDRVAVLLKKAGVGQ